MQHNPRRLGYNSTVFQIVQNRKLSDPSTVCCGTFQGLGCTATHTAKRPSQLGARLHVATRTCPKDANHKNITSRPSKARHRKASRGRRRASPENHTDDATSRSPSQATSSGTAVCHASVAVAKTCCANFQKYAHVNATRNVPTLWATLHNVNHMCVLAKSPQKTS